MSTTEATLVVAVAGLFLTLIGMLIKGTWALSSFAAAIRGLEKLGAEIGIAMKEHMAEVRDRFAGQDEKLEDHGTRIKVLEDRDEREDKHQGTGRR